MFRNTFGDGLEVSDNLAMAAELPDAIEADLETPFDPEGVFVSEGRTHCTSGVVEVAGQALKWTLEMPEDLAYEGVAIFVPGFGGFKGTSKAPTHAMAEAGIASVRYAPLRKDDCSVAERLRRVQDSHVATIEQIAEGLRKKEHLKALPNIDLLDPRRLWLVMHSMGGAAGTQFAHRNTSDVEGASFMATIGLGSPTPLQLVALLTTRGPRAFQHELLPYATSGNINPNINSLLQAVNHYTANPLRTIGEIGSCLTSNLIEKTYEITDRGINTAYFLGEDDCLVNPDDRVAELVGKYYKLRRTGHLFPQLMNRLAAALIRHQMQV